MIYIVGSEERAAELVADLDDANSIRNEVGEPPLLDEVVIADSDEMAAAIAVREAELNSIFVSQFRAENRVLDLRR